MLKDASQIRAARGLLDWSQKDLAERAGISKTTIINIEKGVSPLEGLRGDTFHKILNTFNNAGIDFLDNEGVSKKKDVIEILEGNNAYIQLLDIARKILRNSHGEFLASASDETRSSNQVVNKLNIMRKEGIKMRSLIKNNDTYIMGPLREYRWMPEELYVDGDVKIIFDNYVCYIMSWLGTPRIVIIKDQNIAEENLRLFNYIWNISAKPTHTTSDTFLEGANK